MKDPSIKIVRLRGEELTLEEARSPAYVFAVGTETDTIYALKRPARSGETVDELMIWAHERGLKETLDHARVRLNQLRDATVDPDAAVDPKVQVVGRERVQRELTALAEETGLAPDRELFDIAAKRGILGTVLLFREAYYDLQDDILPLEASSADLAEEYDWNETLSCFNIGHAVVNLYEQVDYGPEPPLATVPAWTGIKLIPDGRTVRSVFF